MKASPKTEKAAEVQRARLPREFYARPTLKVAYGLLGKFLVHKLKTGQKLVGKIVETEAYIGTEDKASHACWRRRETCKVMWGKPGFAYVYLTYGLHHLLNVVTEEDGFPAAVLIRALEPVEGVERMMVNRGLVIDADTDTRRLAGGPGRLTQALGIKVKTHNGADLGGDVLWIGDRGEAVPRSRVARSERVGVGYAKEWAKKPWRFYLKDSPFVSRR